MKGKTIKELRRARAWSQGHLADAAGVSVRTVQRLERTGHCADETLLAIAAALDVDVHHLTAPHTGLVRVGDHAGTDAPHLLWREIDPKHAFSLGLILLAPIALFVLSNVLKYELGAPGLYDFLAAAGESTGLDRFAGFFTGPVLLLGGAFMALLLGLLTQLQVTGSVSEKGFTIQGLRFSFNVFSSLILVGALGGLGILLGYAAMENLAEWILRLTGG